MTRRRLSGVQALLAAGLGIGLLGAVATLPQLHQDLNHVATLHTQTQQVNEQTTAAQKFKTDKKQAAQLGSLRTAIPADADTADALVTLNELVGGAGCTVTSSTTAAVDPPTGTPPTLEAYQLSLVLSCTLTQVDTVTQALPQQKRLMTLTSVTFSTTPDSTADLVVTVYNLPQEK